MSNMIVVDQAFKASSETSLPLTILIPVRNETLNLSIMLRLLKAALKEEHEVLVVIDNPEDSSAEVVQEVQNKERHVHLVLNALGPGIANALQAGVHVASGERVLIFAADEVGPILAIDDMMGLMDEGCHFISCTRYAFGGRRLGGSAIGHLLSYLANISLRLFTRIALTDATTGIKMFRRKDFPDLVKDATSVGWAVAFEMSINAQLMKLPMGEVPIISIDRLFGGKSTFRLVPWVIGYLKFYGMAMKKLQKGERPSVKRRIGIHMQMD
ncbi:glycosyltransferase [Magnetococcales bacterium HHB-1]